ncbi:hypothetical protein AXX17_AT5G56850 [Arabidopsis thaliana]|uniref:Uncharacterized protein n=1 Tax=Arabidopsis thaliana TaxID=3702 RepID=A0A178UFK5_ARATH|nr:hypothetical protein AXX17_AT5G56850 [Arabidopsis thaliana]
MQGGQSQVQDLYENPVYYEPILAGEARAIAKMLMELQAEKEAILAGEAAAIARAVSRLQTEESNGRRHGLTASLPHRLSI